MDLHDYGHQHERVCRANMMLRDRIDLSMRTETGDLQNPILALRHLETQYKMGRTLALHTRDKIDRTTLATSKDMSEYLNKMRQFKNDLLQLRQPVTDDFYLIGKIVKGLPDAYASWIRSRHDIVADASAPNPSLRSAEAQLVFVETTLTPSQNVSS